jgi:hypothetical protein
MSRRLLIGAAVVYTAVLLVFSLTHSNSEARNYFTDITGPVFFYAVNTSVTVLLLAVTAVLFAQCFVLTPADSRRRLFFASQVLVFGSLAFDDRFGMHEFLYSVTGIHDAILLGITGVAELALLVCAGYLPPRGQRESRYLILAGAAFAFMLLVDAFGRPGLRGRLAVEDLSKTWAALLLAMFAWKVWRGRVEAVRTERRDGVYT